MKHRQSLFLSEITIWEGISGVIHSINVVITAPGVALILCAVGLLTPIVPAYCDISESMSVYGLFLPQH
jgi:hypothetical protein